MTWGSLLGPDSKQYHSPKKDARASPRSVPRYFRASVSSERRDFAATERLAEIDALTLVIIGERDDRDNHAIADLLESGIYGARKAMAEATPLPNL